MNALRPRIRRWASHLPDGLVILAIFLIALTVMCGLAAAIGVVLVQIMRLAGGHETAINIMVGAFVILGIMLFVPIIYAFGSLASYLEGWAGTFCPACRWRELEWTGRSWGYGNPPSFLHFTCSHCGARFRQLRGDQVVSDLERVEDASKVTPSGPVLG